jgi:DNA helicase-2/ATP-dependent DNA helicase PcrA
MKPRRGAGKQRAPSRKTRTVRYHPYGTYRLRWGKYEYKEVREALLAVEAAMNGMPLEDFVGALRHHERLSATFKYLPPTAEIHHIDGNVTNNIACNLQVLTRAEHARLHRQKGNFHVDYYRDACIVYKRDAGTRQTYDIVMEAPNNNFEANGIFVHNSGKTTTLVARIARLARDGLDPKYILAMTFTRQAAAEMNDRLRVLGVHGGAVGTIHSLSLSLIKESMPQLLMGVSLDESGYKLDTELRRALGDLRRDKIIRRDDVPDVDGLKRFIACCKAGGLCPTFGNSFGVNTQAEQRIVDEASKHMHGTGGLDPDQLLSVYLHLEHRRAAASLFDFDDMQLFAWQSVLLLPEVRQSWRRWSIVMVDESQDSNPIQWDLARILAGGASRIMPECTNEDPTVPPVLSVYGQAAQSIYSWRAAVPAWLVEFATTPGVALYTLPVNYRSGPEICAVCSELVIREPWHLGGAVVPSSGGKPTSEGYRAAFVMQSYPELYAEVCGAIDHLEKVCEGNWTRGVVLARLAMALHLVEIECIRRKIPYEKRASGAFFDAKEVQDLLAYLRVASGWDTPDRKWMKRCIRVPFRYIGKNALEWADGESRRHGETDYLGTLMRAPMLSTRQVRALHTLETTIEQLGSMINASCTPAECLKFVLDDTMYWDWLKEEGGAMRIDASKVAVIEHVMSLGAVVHSVQEFLSQIDNLTAGVALGRQQQQAKEGNRLVLSTIHRCKGQEFEHTAIIDMAQGRFPWNRGFSSDEELRLLFVAVSRAKRTVSMSCAGAPSSHFERLRTMLEPYFEEKQAAPPIAVEEPAAVEETSPLN